LALARRAAEREVSPTFPLSRFLFIGEGKRLRVGDFKCDADTEISGPSSSLNNHDPARVEPNKTARRTDEFPHLQQIGARTATIRRLGRMAPLLGTLPFLLGAQNSVLDVVFERIDDVAINILWHEIVHDLTLGLTFVA
jgi:hypothetical protein